MNYILFQDENVSLKLLLLHIYITSKQECEFYFESPLSCQRTSRIFILLKAVKKNNKFNPPWTSQ